MTDAQTQGVSTLPEDVRARTRDAFTRLESLPARDPVRAQIRADLVALHLPLVEHLARRFRNRGEPYDDLVQVGTIGLIKAVDRFDLDPRRRVLHVRDAHDRRRDQALVPRQGLVDPGPAATAGAAAVARAGHR